MHFKHHFFFNVENARVQTPLKCGIFHIFFFDGFPNHVHDSRLMAYVQFETNYAEIKVKTGSNNQHTAQLGSTRNETQIMRC